MGAYSAGRVSRLFKLSSQKLATGAHGAGWVFRTLYNIGVFATSTPAVDRSHDSTSCCLAIVRPATFFWHAHQRNAQQDELIRQVTINCAERGLLLLRVRDEVHMTIAAYQTMYESSIAFGIRKALIAEQRKAEMEAKVREAKEKWSSPRRRECCPKTFNHTMKHRHEKHLHYFFMRATDVSSVVRGAGGALSTTD